MSVSNKRALIFDKGLFVALAERLAREFGHVGYYQPWESAFPSPDHVAVGEGIDDVERVYEFWDEVEKADLIVFPDVGNGDLQTFLRNRGHKVWGSGDAQFLELDRLQSRKVMKEVGIVTPPTLRIMGLKNLRRHLELVQDRWVKISLFRGAFETFHHFSMFTTSSWLDVVAQKLGPLAESTEFVVEEGVEGVEIGWDGHCIDGKFPKLGFYGLEVKDRCLLGVMKKFDTLPELVQEVYTGLASVLKDGEYRNYISYEMRLDKLGEKPVVMDPCCRFGSPCSEAWLELVGNIGDIMYEGSQGKLVEVDPVAKYGAIAVIYSEWALSNWTPIDVPKAIRQWVKMKCLTVIDGNYYYVPGDNKMGEMGAIVGIGDTLDEAIGLVEERACMVKGYRLEIQTAALRDGMEEIEAGEEVGLSFD